MFHVIILDYGHNVIMINSVWSTCEENYDMLTPLYTDNVTISFFCHHNEKQTEWSGYRRLGMVNYISTSHWIAYNEQHNEECLMVFWWISCIHGTIVIIEIISNIIVIGEFLLSHSPTWHKSLQHKVYMGSLFINNSYTHAPRSLRIL